MITRLPAAGALLGMAILLAACGGGSSTVAGVAATPAPATNAPATKGGGDYGGATAAAGAAAAVSLATTSLGSVLVDGSGKTLYAFTPDGTGASTCYDSCIAKWPALLSDSAVTLGTGLDAADFGTTSRTDGGSQVTFYGHPLYYFAGDMAAGDTKGQGLGGKWYVIDGTGALVGASAAAPSTAPSAAAAGPSIALGTTALGSIIVDGKGMTLYMFVPDTATTSACTADCLTNWPALAGGGAPTLGTGLDAEDFTSITRPEGGSQVAFYGHPLYYFAGDKSAGDTNGQGLGSKWYVLGKDGNPIK